MEEPNANTVKPGRPVRRKFWSYLSSKELNYFPSTNLRWFLLIILIFVWTVENFERAKMGPVLVYLMEDLHITLASWGAVTALGTALAMVGAYVFSNLADIVGRKSIIIWPMFIYIFIALGTALAPNFATVATLHVIGGVVVSGMFAAVQAAVRDFTPRMGRALSYAWVSLAFILGAFLSNAAGTFIIPIWPGWRPQFWVAAGVALFTFLVVWILYRDLSENIRGNIVKEKTDKIADTVHSAVHSNSLNTRKSGNLVYKDWRMWILSAVILFWVMFYVMAVAYMPLYFTEFFGIEPANAASLSNVFWIVFVFSVFISGWISDKLQVRKTITIFGGITTGIMLLIMAVVPTVTATIYLIILWGLTGFFSGFIYPAWGALLSENAEAISTFGVARAFGMAAILQYFSQVLLHFALPFVVENWGWPTWMLICGICCFLLAICAVFGRGPWWVFRSPTQQPQA